MVLYIKDNFDPDAPEPTPGQIDYKTLDEMDLFLLMGAGDSEAGKEFVSRNPILPDVEEEESTDEAS